MLELFIIIKLVIFEKSIIGKFQTSLPNFWNITDNKIN